MSLELCGGMFSVPSAAEESEGRDGGLHQWGPTTSLNLLREKAIDSDLFLEWL